jgi:hypothetical protein
VKTIVAILLTFFASSQAYSETIEKEWTLIVFLNGVNNLDTFGDLNINQMEEIGSNKNINIVVQWGSYRNPDVLRLFVEKDSDTNKVTSPVVMNLGSSDMGDYKQLVDFVKWAHQNYPAKKYFVDVWNHGSGWKAVRANSDISLMDISFDDRTGNKITTEQLGVAMKQIAAEIGRPVDVYGSDACLMSMAEVATEMQGAVRVFLGSQDLEPGEGWPYNKFLEGLNKDPKMDAVSVGKLLTTEYFKAYSGGIYGTRDVTFSAFDMEYLEAFNKSVARLNQELIERLSADADKIKAAAAATQTFYYNDYADGLDFLNKLLDFKVELSESLVNDFNKAHAKLIIANEASEEFKNAKGISVWLPVGYGYTFESNQQRYQGLEFNKQTNWVQFLGNAQ